VRRAGRDLTSEATMADDGGKELDRAFEGLEREVPDRVSRAIRWLRDPNPHFPVRPDGARRQWRKVPPRELSVDLVADERLAWATERVEAS
jgi:hypothetical protein